MQRVDPGRPFAGQQTHVDVGSCTLTAREPVTTTGGLQTTRSSFSCVGGALLQWVFDDYLIWMLDGDQRLIDLVQSAYPAWGD